MSETTLLERLRGSELLSPEQLRELAALPEAREGEPKALAKAVLHRGWLTKFQINQAAMGKAKDLFVGPYVVQDRLGEGGMGQVFKARHRHMKRIVALKLMKKEKLGSEEAVHRFYQEVEAAAQLTHPNIVMAFDAGQAGSSHFFSMEYVEGMDLMRLVHDQGVLPVAEACDFIRQAAVGLQHAHERGLVHRDIKPANLLLTGGAGPPVVKILDMGLARLGDTFAKERNLTKMGQVLGTPDYLAPEQAIDARNVDIRADIYSLGCSLYFLLTRRAPFQAESLAELLMKHQMQEPTPVRSLRPDAPEALEALLKRLLAKKPQQRPSTPAEVAVALEPFARGEKGVPAYAVVPPPPPSLGGGSFAGLTDDGGGLIARPPARSRLDRTQDEKPDRPRKGKREEEPKSNKALLIAGGIGGAGVLVLLTIVGLVLALGGSKNPPEKTVQPKTPPTKLAVQDAVQPPVLLEKKAPTPPKREPPQVEPVVVDGTIFAAVEEAVREGRTQKTSLRGAGPLAYDEVPPEGAVLVGLKLGLGKFNQNDVIHSIQPLFLTRKGKQTGEAHGTASDRVVTVEAKSGYAIGAVTVKSGLGIDGMRITFMAIEGSTLNPAKSYESEWYGGEGGGPRTALTGGGATVVGVFGRTSTTQAYVNGFGLVLFSTTRPNPVAPPPFSPPPLVTDISPLLNKVVGEVGGFRIPGLGGGSVRFLKDAKRAAAASFRELCVYDLETQKRLSTVAVERPSSGSLAVAPDAKTYALGLFSGDVLIWDVESGKEQRKFSHAGPVSRLAFSPDGKYLAVAARTETVQNPNYPFGGYGLMLWDLQTGTSRHIPFGNLTNVAAVAMAFSEDSEWLMVCNSQKALLAWNVKTGALSEARTPNEVNTSYLAAVNKSQVLLSGMKGDIQLWDHVAGRPVKTFRGHTGRIHGLAVLPGGKQFVSVAGRPPRFRRPGQPAVPEVDRDATLRVWDIEKGVEIARTTFPQMPWTIDVASDGAHALVNESDGSVRLIDLRKLPAVDSVAAKPAAPAKPAERFAGHTGTINSVTFSPDGTYLLTAGEDGTARQWDAKTGVEVQKFTALGGASCGRFSGNGKRLLVLPKGNSGSVYDAAKGTFLYSLLFSRTADEVSGDLSPDGMEAVVVDTRLYTFRGDLTTRRASMSSRTVAVQITCAAYFPDGGFFAYGDAAGMVRVHNTLLNKDTGSYLTHKGGPVLSLVVQGGKIPRVISGGQDKTIAVRSGKALKTIRRLTGHEGPVTGLSLSADGKRLASCSKDKTVCVWDMGTGRQLNKVAAEEAVLGVALAPDGKSVVSCGEKGLRFWDLTAAKP